MDVDADPTYYALDPDNSDIRLIKLLPGAFSSEIHCSMGYCSLNDGIRYEALSYVWGGSSGAQHIMLDGRPFNVTDNLHLALQFLRRPEGGSERLFWVDAVCINQDDVEEKNSQVAMMGEIYSKAERVVCWLGGPTENGIVSDDGYGLTIFDALKMAWPGDPWEPGALSACLKFENDGPIKLRSRRGDGSEGDLSTTRDILASLAIIRYMGDEMGDHEHAHLVGELPLFEEVQTASRQGVAVASAFRGAYEALAALMDNPWWERIWTVQEPVLAREPENLGLEETVWMACFHITIPFTMLKQASYWTNIHALYCCMHALNDLPNDEGRVLSKVISTSGALRVLENGRRRKLCDLLRSFRDRKATDPRDKINGLLALSSWKHTSEPLRADYSIDVKQTFIRATMKMIEEDRSLDVLDGRTDLEAVICGHRLPSWVQNWTEPRDKGCGFREPDWKPLYSAGGDGLPVTTTLCCDSILVSEGVVVDDIVTVGPICQPSEGEERIFAIWREWEKIAGADDASATYRDGTPLQDAFRSTLGGDMVKQTRTLTRGWGEPPPDFYRSGDTGRDKGRRGYSDDEPDKDLCRNWWHVVEQDSDVELKQGWVNHIVNVVLPCTENHRFLLTRSGFMGIGPAGMVVSDSVVVIRGGRLPFILRHSEEPRHGGDCRHGGKPGFQLIGTAYVHGVMDGEGMVEGRDVQLVHLY